MPEIGDPYIRGEILPPRGNQMARDHVVARSQDASGNFHKNPLLDTRTYQVEFAGGKLT